jgi:hypothetical protein
VSGHDAGRGYSGGCVLPRRLMFDARHVQIAGMVSKPEEMSASVVSVDGDEITLEVKVKLSGSMLESEESILAALKEAGCLATGKALERFDADGSPSCPKQVLARRRFGQKNRRKKLP